MATRDSRIETSPDGTVPATRFPISSPRHPADSPFLQSGDVGRRRGAASPAGRRPSEFGLDRPHRGPCPKPPGQVSCGSGTGGDSPTRPRTRPPGLVAASPNPARFSPTHSLDERSPRHSSWTCGRLWIAAGPRGCPTDDLSPPIRKALSMGSPLCGLSLAGFGRSMSSSGDPCLADRRDP